MSFTPFHYSPYKRKKALGRPLSGVVATCSKTGTGYHPFPQVRAFTPQTHGVYSPSMATRVVATFWLPTGYQRKPTFRGVNLDVAARGRMHRTREHRLEKWEPLSGSDPRISTECHRLAWLGTVLDRLDKPLLSKGFQEELVDRRHSSFTTTILPWKPPASCILMASARSSKQIGRAHV